MSLAYVGLGSNVEPEQNLRRTARLLRDRFPTMTFSRVYRTAAQEVEDQPDFLNAVAKVETTMPPDELFEELRSMENALGKSLPYPKGPRTIDLDLLLYNNLVLPSIEEWIHCYQLPATRYPLFVPHPRLHLRRFVLEPLCELLNPEGTHPLLKKPFRELLEECRSQRCDRVKISL